MTLTFRAAKPCHFASQKTRIFSTPSASEFSISFQRMYYLEKACQIQIAAQSAGQPLVLPSEDICRRAER